MDDKIQLNQEVLKYRKALRDDILKSTYTPKYIFENLPRPDKPGGKLFHEIIGLDIPINYVDKVYDGMTDEEIYGNKLYHGDQYYKQDKLVKEPGLKDLIGESGSKQHSAMKEAQKKRINDLKNQPENYDEEFGEISSPSTTDHLQEEPEEEFEEEEDKKCKPDEEEEKPCGDGYKEGGIKKRVCGKDGKWGEWDMSKCIPKDKKEKSDQGESREDQKEDEEKKGAGPEKKNVAKDTIQTDKAKQFKEGLDKTKEASKQVVKQGAKQAAGEAAKKTAGKAAWEGLKQLGLKLAPLLLSWEFLLGVAVVLIIIVLVVFLTGLLGKNFSIDADPYTEHAKYTYTVDATDSKKALEELKSDLPAFKKRIENYKSTATGKNKDQIIKLCDEIIADINNLEKLGDSDEDKGKKQQYITSIQQKIKELWPLLYACDQYDLKNKTYSPTAGVYFYELPGPGENGFPDYISTSSNQYATGEFICYIGNIIKTYNDEFKKQFPKLLVDGAIPDVYKIRVRDLSAPTGGPLGKHVSHQLGNDVDFVIWNGVMDAGNEYNQQVARLLLKIANQFGGERTTIFYNDPTLIAEKLCYEWPNHANHFHIRLENVNK